MLYGEETFLFSSHFGPLLVTLAAFGTFTKARPVILVLTAMLIVNSAANNYIQFRWAGDEFHRHPMQHQQVGCTEAQTQKISGAHGNCRNKHGFSLPDYWTRYSVNPQTANAPRQVPVPSDTQPPPFCIVALHRNGGLCSAGLRHPQHTLAQKPTVRPLSAGFSYFRYFAINQG
jgi:hypothetical protein